MPQMYHKSSQVKSDTLVFPFFLDAYNHTRAPYSHLTIPPSPCLALPSITPSNPNSPFPKKPHRISNPPHSPPPAASAYSRPNSAYSSS